MELELKDVTGFLGIDAKSLEDFKAKFSPKFVSRKEATEDDEIVESIKSKITGKFSGTVNTLVKRLAKLTNEDLEGKKYEEVIELAISKLSEENKTLKESQGKGTDEKIKELEEKNAKISILLDSEKEAKGLLKKTLEEKEADWNGKFKGIKVESVLSAAKQKIAPKLIELSEEQRFFFENKIKESYKIDFDEQENPIVLGQDGKRINDPNKAGDFIGLEDAILKIAEEKNYVKKNSGGSVSQEIFKPRETVLTTEQKQTERKVHPNAVKHAQVLKENSVQ